VDAPAAARARGADRVRAACLPGAKAAAAPGPAGRPSGRRLAPPRAPARCRLLRARALARLCLPCAWSVARTAGAGAGETPASCQCPEVGAARVARRAAVGLGRAREAQAGGPLGPVVGALARPVARARTHAAPPPPRGPTTFPARLPGSRLFLPHASRARRAAPVPSSPQTRCNRSGSALTRHPVPVEGRRRRLERGTAPWRAGEASAEAWCVPGRGAGLQTRGAGAALPQSAPGARLQKRRAAGGRGAGAAAPNHARGVRHPRRCARRAAPPHQPPRWSPPPQGLKIEPFKHPITMDPNYAGARRAGACAGGAGACSAPPQQGAAAVAGPSTRRRPHAAPPPSRHPAAAPPPDKTWKILEDAIHEIHNQNASGLSFEELYRCEAKTGLVSAGHGRGSGGAAAGHREGVQRPSAAAETAAAAPARVCRGCPPPGAKARGLRGRAAAAARAGAAAALVKSGSWPDAPPCACHASPSPIRAATHTTWYCTSTATGCTTASPWR
jgi:hypothetical protein